jgi:DNA-binding XRE family transcriptional regulator
MFLYQRRLLVNIRRIGKISSDMLFAAQIRAARALLDWRQDDLARAAEVGITTIRRIEAQTGPLMGYVSTMLRLQAALEKAGIIFTDEDDFGGIGVRLKKKKR